MNINIRHLTSTLLMDENQYQRGTGGGPAHSHPHDEPPLLASISTRDPERPQPYQHSQVPSSQGTVFDPTASPNMFYGTPGPYFPQMPPSQARNVNQTVPFNMLYHGYAPQFPHIPLSDWNSFPLAAYHPSQYPTMMMNPTQGQYVNPAPGYNMQYNVIGPQYPQMMPSPGQAFDPRAQVNQSRNGRLLHPIRGGTQRGSDQRGTGKKHRCPKRNQTCRNCFKVGH